MIKGVSMHTNCLTLLAACGMCTLFAPAASAQNQKDLLHAFQLQHPGAHAYFEDGALGAVYGRAFATGDSPEQTVEDFLDHHAEMIGPELGDLRAVPGDTPDTSVRGVMYDRITDTFKFSLISFEQTMTEVPVFRSRIGFLMRNEPGYPMVLAGWSVRDLSGFDLPERGNPGVTRAMSRAVAKKMGADDVTVEREPELVIYAGAGRVHERPRLAVVFTASHGSAATYPNYKRELIVADAQTGEILFSENQIHHFEDVVGNVSGLATDGWQSGNCDHQVLGGMPYAEASIEGGETVFADVNGDFVIPHGGSGDVTVKSPLRGPWFEVFDQSIRGHIPVLTMDVSPPGPTNFVHNESNNEFSRANVDCYLHANIIRDYVLAYVPNFPVIDKQPTFDIRTNIDWETCNAFYNDGVSIDFLISEPGKCANSGYSTVVYHEYGHHLVEMSNNGQNQFGEGAGDTMSVLIIDEPEIGVGFFECNEAVRSAANNIQYPCAGDDCGILLSGVVWEARNELVITEPIEYRDIISSLFVNMLIVRGATQGQNGSQITPFITRVFLVLDDDDHDIGNGTPHCTEIQTGFGAHNMAVDGVECAGTVPSDLDGDGDVDAADLAILLGSWGPCDDCDDCPADFNDDCAVNAADLAQLLGNWGP